MEAMKHVRGQKQLLSLVKMESVEVTRALEAGTPRQVASLSVSVDEGLRTIRDLAVKLLVPQSVVAAAQTFFHRVKFHAALYFPLPFPVHLSRSPLPCLQSV